MFEQKVKERATDSPNVWVEVFEQLMLILTFYNLNILWAATRGFAGFHQSTVAFLRRREILVECFWWHFKQTEAVMAGSTLISNADNIFRQTASHFLFAKEEKHMASTF